MLFNCLDYKDFIKSRIAAAHPSRGYVGVMAKAAGCQRSYLSQALNSSVHLTPDHAFALSRFFQLNDLETKYFLLLVDHARCGSAGLRKHLQEQMDQIRESQKNLSRRLKTTTTSGEDHGVYYSSWHWQAIHYATTIKTLQTAEAIAQRLLLPKSLVVICLNQLITMGLVVFENGRFRHKGDDLHLHSRSRWISIHHNNWRQRAVLNSQVESEKHSIHYSSVFSMSRKDFLRLHEETLRFIEHGRQIIGPSNEEELFCFNTDLFEI